MSDKITKVLIFSDTHGELREIPYIKHHEEYDYLIYLGDGYDEVEKWAIKNGITKKFIAVTGNCDFAPSVERQKLFEIDSVRIFITHGDIYDVKSGYKMIFDQ